MNLYNPSSRHAFTLIEMSIVLVIIGLIVGGIMLGQDLIRSARLRSVVTQFKTFDTAANLFREQYGQLPGDMYNATDYWGSAGCPTTAGNRFETCNGDGDFNIEIPAAASQFGERFTFWQHLSNAGLIEGRYTGITGPANQQDHTLANSPSGNFPSSAWSAVFRGAGISNTFDRIYGNSLYIGGRQAGGPNIRIFTPKEAWEIDQKLDDGMPATGFITPINSIDNCTNATSTTHWSAEYEITTTSPECTLHFVNRFGDAAKVR